MSNMVVSRITAISVDPDTHDQPITFLARLKSHVLINRSRKGKERKVFSFRSFTLKAIKRNWNRNGCDCTDITRWNESNLKEITLSSRPCCGKDFPLYQSRTWPDPSVFVSPILSLLPLRCFFPPFFFPEFFPRRWEKSLRSRRKVP